MKINRRQFVQLASLASSQLVFSPALKANLGHSQLSKPLTHFCFGSCNNQNKPQNLLSQVAKDNPELFVWLGDTIYGDTEDMSLLRDKYQKLKTNNHFKNLAKTCPMIGVWDDHDYGRNNAGKDYPKRTESQEVFCDFYDLPATHPRRLRKGIYGREVFGPLGKRVKFILLDVRYHREDRNDPDADMLGQAQWDWLEQELSLNDAEIHVICSSIGVLKPMWVAEDWKDLKKSHRKLMNLIYDLRPNGSFFISGDKHFSAVIKGSHRGDDFYEWMSSGMTHSLPGYAKPAADLIYGTRNVFYGYNYAECLIDWDLAIPTITLNTRNSKGRAVLSRSFEVAGSSLKII